VSNLEIALKNKDKLTTFSPDDFLNDFQKENKKENNENEDEFVFCVIIKYKIFLIYYL